MIQKIRKNTWILFVVVGLALAAFILMDATGSSSGMSANDLSFAEVDGQKLDMRELQRAEQILYGNNSELDMFQRRGFLYDFFTSKVVVENEAEKLGLSVGEDELEELSFGTNLSPVISQRFPDPSTGLVDRQRLNNIKLGLENGQATPEIVQYWNFQNKEIVKAQLESKIANMVDKAIYTPTWMVEEIGKDQNIKANVEFVKIPYTDVDNAEVSVTDADLRAYYNERQSQYEQKEETRTLDYVVFSVEPTREDSMNLLSEMDELIRDFKITDNDTLFVEGNYGSLDLAFVKEADLFPNEAAAIFNTPVDSIYGPYIQGRSYKAAKVLAEMTIPDSVKTRHILRSVNTQQELIAADRLIDSLKGLIESGAQRFDSLAVAFSQDPGSAANGGEYGYIGPNTFVKPYNDAMFFHAEEGELVKVYTEFGIHLIEIMDKKFINNDRGIQVAYLDLPIIPSEATQDYVYQEALDLLSNNRTIEELDAAAATSSLNVQTSAPFTENAFSLGLLGTGQTARDMIRFAFEAETKEGDVANEVFVFQDPELYFNKNVVVAGLSDINEEGLNKLEDVRSRIQPLVLNQVKGKYLADKVGSNTDLNALASQYSVNVDSSLGINFTTQFAQSIGDEPDVIAHIMNMDAGQTSGPIIGKSGLFVVKVLSKDDSAGNIDVAGLRNATTLQGRNVARSAVINSLVDKAKIKDLRSRYY